MIIEKFSALHSPICYYNKNKSKYFLACELPQELPYESWIDGVGSEPISSTYLRSIVD